GGGDPVEPAHRVVAVAGALVRGGRPGGAQGEARGPADGAGGGGVVGAGEDPAAQVAREGLGLQLRRGGAVGEGARSRGVGHGGGLAQAVVGVSQGRGAVGIADARLFAGSGIIAVGGGRAAGPGAGGQLVAAVVAVADGVELGVGLGGEQAGGGVVGPVGDIPGGPG